MVADGDRSGPCCDVFRRRVLSIADHSLGPGWIAACQAVKGISLVGQHAAGQVLVLVRVGEGDIRSGQARSLGAHSLAEPHTRRRNATRGRTRAWRRSGGWSVIGSTALGARARHHQRGWGDKQPELGCPDHTLTKCGDRQLV